MTRVEAGLTRPLRCGMLLAALLTPFGSTTIAVALPGIGRDLGVEPARLNMWLVAGYLLVSIVGQSPGGMLGDRIGHGRALMAGIGLHALGAALGSAATELAGLAAARLLMAAGGAVTIPAVMALLRARVPAGRRARAFGALGGAMGLAAALGPPVGGGLVVWFGWRAIFAMNLPIIALVLALAARPALRLGAASRPAAARRRPDLAGAALLVAGLAPLILAAAPSAGAGAGAVIAGLALLALFAAWETRAAEPLLDPRLFGRHEFAAGSSLVALHNFAMYGLLFHIPAAAGRIAAPGAGGAGRLLFGMLGGMVIGSPLGGRIAERAGARGTAIAGSALALAGLAIVPDFATLASSSRALIGFVLLGTGLGLASAPAQASAMGVARADRAGAAGGALSTMRYLGGLAGIALINAMPSAPVLRDLYFAALAASVLFSLWLPGRRLGPIPAEPVEAAPVVACPPRDARVHTTGI